MNCVTVCKLLNEYIEDNLTGDLRNAISQHILECKECAKEEKLLRLLFSGLRSLPKKSASESFTQEVMARLMEFDEEPDLYSSEETASKSITNEQGVISMIAYRSGAQSTWKAVRTLAHSVSFVKYVPRPTVKLRIGSERARSLTKMPFALGFRW